MKREMLNHETDVIGNSQNALKTSNALVQNPVPCGTASVWSLVFSEAQLLGDADRNWNWGLRKFVT